MVNKRGPKQGGGERVGRVPNSSCQPDFSPNPSYQICNPISSARLLTDAHHEVKALIDAIWIMNLHSPRPKKITHPAGEHSSSSNPCWHHHIKTTSVFCTILIQITVFPFLFFATAVIITLRTSAGSLRSKSFHPRSSRKLGREHNKEGGGEKGNACPETPQSRKMYTQLLIGAVLVVLIKEWLIYQLNQVCFVHLSRR